MSVVNRPVKAWGHEEITDNLQDEWVRKAFGQFAVSTSESASLATLTGVSYTIVREGPVGQADGWAYWKGRLRVGAFVSVTPPPDLPSGLIPTAWVSATETLKLRLFNATAGSLSTNVGRTWSFYAYMMDDVGQFLSVAE